jgi:long-chain acyl-CoA synthetase
MEYHFQNVPELLHCRAKDFGSKSFLRQAESENDITYSELLDRSCRVAGLLNELGVRKEERVAVLLQNSPEFASAVLGSQVLGAVPGPINVLLKAQELEYILNHQEAKVLIADSEFLPLVNQIKDRLQTLEKIVEVNSRYPHGLIVHPVKAGEIKAFYGISKEGISDLPSKTLNPSLKIATWDQIAPFKEKVSLSEKSPALILYTSGTTGVPKGALLSHGAILEVSEHLKQQAEGVPEDVVLNALPLFHIFGIIVTLFGPLYLGASAVTLKTFNPELFVQALIKFQATAADIVPTIAFILLQVAEKVGKMPELPKLTRVICGAATLPVAVHQKFEKIFGVKIFEGYGLTEACMAGCLNTTRGERRKWGSVGKALPGFNQIAIFDDKDQPITSDQIGEVVIRGKNVMMEYIKDPVATAEALKDGWLHTGDMGFMDADGYLYIVDRKKDMIIVGGENVYPREVEDLLAGHPDIAEAAVLGVPNEKYGEEVVACVGLKKPGLDEQKVIAFAKQNLAAFKVPHHVVFFDKLPRNPAGKVLKATLRAKIADLL